MIINSNEDVYLRSGHQQIQTSSLKKIQSPSQRFQQNFHTQLIESIFKYSSILQLTKDTPYLAISYLQQIYHLDNFTFSNIQKLALGLLLISTKINQITPPSFDKILKLAKKTSKDQLIEMEYSICQKINFDLIIRQTHYSAMAGLLWQYNLTKSIQKFEKILYKLVKNPNSLIYEIKYLAFTTLYIVKPSILRIFSAKISQNVKQIIHGLQIDRVISNNKKESL